MKVQVYVINRGTPAEYYGLRNLEGAVLHAPNNWKTAKAAIRWAEKHGYTVTK